MDTDASRASRSAAPAGSGPEPSTGPAGLGGVGVVASDVAATVPPGGPAGGGPVPPVAATAPVPGAAPIAPRRRRRRTAGAFPYALILPSIAVLVALLGYPLYVLARASFQQLNLRQLIRRETVWVGFDNYSTILTDREFWSVTLRTLIFAAVCVGLTIGAGTLVALLMKRISKPMRLLVSAGMLLAWATPPVSAATVFRWLFDEQYGVVNWAVTTLTPLDWSQRSWFADQYSAFTVIILCVVWQAIPFVALTLYAGLVTIPDTLFEAAELDGANAWRTFWSVTGPMLKPVFLILTSLSVIWDLKVFTQVYVITRGGPDKQTVLMNLYTYNQGFGVSRFGLASAAAVIMVLLTLAVTVWYVRTMVRVGEEDL